MTFFCLNYSYTVWKLLGSAVTRMDLHNDGKQVTFHFEKFAMVMGTKTETVNIKDIKKCENEKSLVETFEESSLYPINVSGNTYYLNGPG